MHITFDVFSFLAGLAGGIAITIFSINIRKRMSSSNGGHTVDQSGTHAGGDIVGRDKKQ